MQLLKHKKLTETQTKLLIEQMLLTTDFMHRKGIIHRDIKLENILVNDIEDAEHFDVKIADFGIAIVIPP
jgi:serine/threonine protein kinase